MDTFKSIITRIGQDSVYCIMGDTEQIDLKNKKQSALIKIMHIFKNDPLIGIVEFTDADCVRNKIISPILNKLREYEVNELKEKDTKDNKDIKQKKDRPKRNE